MIRLIRLSVIFISPALFWAGSYVFPSLLQAENLRLLSGIITALWAMDFIFFQRLGSLTNLNSLGSKDLENLNFRFVHIRQRVWWMAIVCLFCSILIWIITGGELVEDTHTMSLYVGVLFGICISYLAVFPFWFNELQAFQDRLKVSEAEKAKRDAALKQLTDAAKR
jgi:hypothetical protein